MTILQLIEFPLEDERAARELVAQNPKLCAEDYRRTMREIPNLHDFMCRVRIRYTDPSIPGTIWFRLWHKIKTEEKVGVDTTLKLLREMPSMDDRPVELQKNPGPKVIEHCFKVLHALVSTADQAYS